jgi:4-hydroxybenzoate polyprenyltransferase
LKFIKAIVYSNLWIALGASCFTASTYLICDLSINYNYLFLVFFATFFAYNYQRLARINLLSPPLSERQSWIIKHQRVLRIASLFSFALAIFLALFTLSFSQILWLLPCGVLVVLYATFLVNNKRGLRDIPFVKILFIALVWGYVLGVFPLILSNSTLHWQWVFLERSLFIMALAIPFDIRDLNVDSADKKTLPQVFGINGSKALAILFLASSLFVQWALLWTSLTTIKIAFYIAVALLILFSNPNRNELYFSGLLDGVLVVYLLIYL